MKPLSDSIPNVLQSILSLEVKFMENCHTNEHLWQRKGYGKLKKMLDKCVGKSRCRKRVVLDRILQFDVDPDTSGDGGTVLYRNLTAVFQYMLDSHNALNDAYQTAVSVCRQFDDSVTEDLLNDQQYVIQKMISKIEAKLQQISDVGGEQVYLSTLVG